MFMLSWLDFKALERLQSSRADTPQGIAHREADQRPEFSEKISRAFGFGLPLLLVAFPEPLKLSPPFVSQVWWLLRCCLVPLWFRKGFGTFFFFTLRRGFLSGLRQLHLRQGFEGLE